MSKLLETRKGTGVYFIIGSIVSSIVVGIVLGIPVWLIDGGKKDFISAIIIVSRFMFMLGGFPMMICGLLHLITSVNGDWCFRLGFILYYGTVLLKRFIGQFLHGADFDLYLISFVIASLLSYVIYNVLKNEF